MLQLQLRISADGRHVRCTLITGYSLANTQEHHGFDETKTTQGAIFAQEHQQSRAGIPLQLPFAPLHFPLLYLKT